MAPTAVCQAPNDGFLSIHMAPMTGTYLGIIGMKSIIIMK